METLAIGIDIVELDRIRGVHERHGERFLERVLTPAERQLAARRRDPTTFLAGRFAVKESVLKVLGTGLSQGLGWQSISVLREPSGAPRVFLHGAALARARSLGIGNILVSISHGRDHAVAQAVGVSGDASALELPADD